MDFTFSEEQTAVSDLATQIIGDKSEPAALRALEQRGGDRFDRELWAALTDAGLLGISLPESAGGAGLGLIEAGCVIRAAGYHAAAVPVWETLGLGAPAIAEFAPADIADEWLGRVAAGTAVLTAAWHDALGDPLDPQLVTFTAEGGDSTAGTVTGLKVCVPAGNIADAAVVSVKGPNGPALVLVDLSASGVTRTPETTTAGTPEASIEFASTPATLLAEGADALVWAFDRAVATQCTAALGTAEAALALTAEYTKERKQFDVPIATFQAVGHRAADTFIDTQTIRLTAWHALWRLSTGLPASEEVATAKYWAAHSGHRISLASAHLHGGVGVDRDYPLHRHFIAAKQYELQLGGATQSLLRLGRSIAANA
jgi:alkylation response protein AidB-like acyl-CoA dehydrogenase